MNKKMAAAGLAAGLVAGAGAGLVLEMTGSAGAASPAATDATTDTTDTTGTSDTTATDGTTDTAADEATETAEHTARLQAVLQPLIDNGTLTQSQADAVIAALAAAGPMGHGGPGHHGGPALDVVATTLGITEDEVRAGLESGQTLAEIAVAHGSTADALVMAIVAEIQTHVAQDVAAGEITQAEADARLADVTARVTEMVNSTPPVGPFGAGPRGGD